MLSNHEVLNKSDVAWWVYLQELQQINSFHHTRHAQSTTQAFTWNKTQCFVCGRLTSVLPLAIFFSVSGVLQSSAPPADHSSSQPASQTSCGVIACQSCLRACFSSRCHAPDKKHIFTHKNEITGNLRAGALEATPAIELSKSMNSSHPWLYISSKQKWKMERRTDERGGGGEETFGNSGLASMLFPLHYISSTAHFSFFFVEQTTLPVFKLLQEVRLFRIIQKASRLNELSSTGPPALVL